MYNFRLALYKTMISLRSLCLLYLHSRDRLVMPLLPVSLAKDLQTMQLVNTNFESLHYDHQNNCTQTVLTIQYDGVCWNFYYFSNRFQIICCNNCDCNQPSLKQFCLEEGKLVPTQSPFLEVSNLLDMLEQKVSVGLKMILSFEMNEIGTSGKISFSSSDDFASVPVVFSSDLVVEINPSGQKKLHCNGFLGRGRLWQGCEVLQSLPLPTMFQDCLLESPGTIAAYKYVTVMYIIAVSAQDVFSNNDQARCCAGSEKHKNNEDL